MNHLCIINPMAGHVSGHVNEVKDEIRHFFAGNPQMNYAIHVTRWKRDASGFVLRYVNNASETVRVYAFGGGGTLFEVVNGVVGLPNVQVAWYPLGREDGLLYAFGENSRDAFQSLKNLTLSPVIPFDTILVKNHIVVGNLLIGFEAVSYQKGRMLAEEYMLPLNASYLLAGFFYALIKPAVQHYHIKMDSIELEDDFIGCFVGNAFSYGVGKFAPDARFNDGYMDLYTLKPPPKRLGIRVAVDYIHGQYAKWPDYIRHYQCKKLRITSPKNMILSMDGEIFYDRELNLELLPASLDFVCPSKIAGDIFPAEQIKPGAVPEKHDSLPKKDLLQDIITSGELR